MSLASKTCGTSMALRSSWPTTPPIWTRPSCWPRCRHRGGAAPLLLPRRTTSSKRCGGPLDRRWCSTHSRWSGGRFGIQFAGQSAGRRLEPHRLSGGHSIAGRYSPQVSDGCGRARRIASGAGYPGRPARNLRCHAARPRLVTFRPNPGRGPLRRADLPRAGRDAERVGAEDRQRGTGIDRRGRDHLVGRPTRLRAPGPNTAAGQLAADLGTDRSADPRGQAAPGQDLAELDSPAMSGHSKWATTKHKKAVVDARRGKLFAKLIKNIEVAARVGGGDPAGNPTLYDAIQKGKKSSVPNDNIDRAIKRGSGAEAGGADYQTLMYEAYGPVGIALLIECLTDNRNRSASDVRVAVTRNGS